MSPLPASPANENLVTSENLRMEPLLPLLPVLPDLIEGALQTSPSGGMRCVLCKLSLADGNAGNSGNIMPGKASARYPITLGRQHWQQQDCILRQTIRINMTAQALLGEYLRSRHHRFGRND